MTKKLLNSFISNVLKHKMSKYVIIFFQLYFPKSVKNVKKLEMSSRGEEFHFGIPFGLFRLDDIFKSIDSMKMHSLGSRCTFPKVVDIYCEYF